MRLDNPTQRPVRLRLFLWRIRLRNAYWAWRTRKAMVMSAYDAGRVFWRVAEPVRLKDFRGEA